MRVVRLRFCFFVETIIPQERLTLIFIFLCSTDQIFTPIKETGKAFVLFQVCRRLAVYFELFNCQRTV